MSNQQPIRPAIPQGPAIPQIRIVREPEIKINAGQPVNQIRPVVPPTKKP
jgi:hypothetical protein